MTRIEYALPYESNVTLTIYNILGQEVAALVDEKQDAGYKMIQFDASKVASGVYFYRLEARQLNGAGSFVDVKKMVVVK